MRKLRFLLPALAVLALAGGIAEAQQRKNRGNANRPGGPGGPGGPPPIGQVLPPFLQDELKVTAAQRKQIEALQKEVDEKLAAILTEEQNKSLQKIRERGPRGFGPPPGRGFGGPPGGGPGGPGFGGPGGPAFGGPPGGGPGGPGFGGPGGGPGGPGFGGPGGGGPDGPGFGGPAGGRERSPINDIMVKIGSRRNSLTQLLGQELKQSRPSWNKIQSQTREYAQQAADLANYDPPRGSKESWTKLTADFAASATEMDKAAQAKDAKTALAAQSRLVNSCMACHREHRAMRPGPGGQ